MKTNPAPPTPAAAQRRRRAWPCRRRRLDTGRLHLGMAWVLGFLIRVRYDVAVAWVAAMAGVGDQSLRDCLSFLRPDGWHTLSRTALLLGFYPDELERLTRRWMRKYRHREKRLHGMERGWRLLYPWEKKQEAETVPPDPGQPG